MPKTAPQGDRDRAKSSAFDKQLADIEKLMQRRSSELASLRALQDGAGPNAASREAAHKEPLQHKPSVRSTRSMNALDPPTKLPHNLRTMPAHKRVAEQLQAYRESLELREELQRRVAHHIEIRQKGRPARNFLTENIRTAKLIRPFSASGAIATGDRKRIQGAVQCGCGQSVRPRLTESVSSFVASRSGVPMTECASSIGRAGARPRSAISRRSQPDSRQQAITASQSAGSGSQRSSSAPEPPPPKYPKEEPMPAGEASAQVPEEMLLEEVTSTPDVTHTPGGDTHYQTCCTRHLAAREYTCGRHDSGSGSAPVKATHQDSACM